MNPVQIKTNKLFNAVSVAAGATSTKRAIGLNDIGLDGYLSAEITITGTGTGTVGMECSSDGLTWFTPSAQSAVSTGLVVASGLTASAGPDSDGKYFVQVKNFPTCNFIRFFATETGSSNAIVVTLTVIGQ